MEIKEFKVPKSYERDMEKAIKLLKGEGCSEIYLFGSLLSEKLTSTSDIDIGVRGCPGRRFFRLYSKLSDELEHPVDLVDFDSEEEFFSMLHSIEEIVRIG
jgi:predicted nucleotidyltransferase